jgi:glycosyltransferase involved in cell wall biosynthesis
LESVDEHWLLDRHPEARVVAISDSQVATIGVARRRSIPTVYHGLDLQQYEFGPEHQGYALFLGRMGPNKNPDGAIRIALAAGFPIVLAGGPQNGREKDYFANAVQPLLADPAVTYLGPVSHQEKVRLLRHAAALVFPIQWDEHFGLVMIEAMACGTPVVACKRGSVPEVVDEGVTGFSGVAEAELVDALPRAATLDRHAIRRRAQERFNIERMADDYVRVYERALGAEASAR